MTLREVIEQGLATHFHTDGVWITAEGMFPTCEGCGEVYPCPDRKRYESALRSIDEDYSTLRAVLEEIVRSEPHLAAHEMASIAKSALERLATEETTT